MDFSKSPTDPQRAGVSIVIVSIAMATRRHWATAQERIFNLSWVLLELDFEDTQHPQGAAQNAESVDHIRESVWCGVVIDIFRHSNTCISSNDLVYLVTIF